jgi:hypothetical protein
MSHVARVELEVKDLAALKAAAKAAGLEWKEGQQHFKWYGGNNRCEHAIGVPNNDQAYEIGVCKNPQGPGHMLVWDFWNGGFGLQKLAGNNCSNIVKGYAAEVAKKKMVAQGYTCAQTKLPTGEIKLVFTKYS